MKRGVLKSFRDYLNAMHGFDHANWRHNQYRQVSREYGDYLYFQDRAMFDEELRMALEGDSLFADWEHSPARKG